MGATDVLGRPRGDVTKVVPDFPFSLEAEVDLMVSALELYDLEVTDPRGDFDEVVAVAEREAREGQVGDVRPARALYRCFGVDPTRYRPSNEALLRRVRRGEPFPRINSLVDVANVVSLRLQVPVGLYDLDRVQGRLRLRLGREREGYLGIRRGYVDVSGRICVADDLGPCGNPSADSARTMITTGTRRAAWVFFLPVAESALSLTCELIARYGRGRVRRQ
jgi:DNA/RNA-binding domain of Phe-tRNA-synthetase-like protein